MERDKKNIVVGMLLAAICIMSVGYAALAQQLTVNGTVQITSKWEVQITDVSKYGSASVGVTTKEGYPKYTATTAEFDVELTSPGDTITYALTITNSGTLNAVLDSITTIATDANKNETSLTGINNEDAIQYEVTGVTKGTKLSANNGTNIVYVKVTYNPEYSEQPTEEQAQKHIAITLNYVQDIS